MTVHNKDLDVTLVTRTDQTCQNSTVIGAGTLYCLRLAVSQKMATN